MIRSASDMMKFEIVATDGRLGSIDDFYFDDERWAIRYVGVDINRWLPGRRVLISPQLVSRTEWNEQRLLLSISRDQVQDCIGAETHLRSASDVSGYAIQAADGDLGHVEDVLFDDLSWAARYFVVQTSNWWFGQRVLIAPEWISEISWPEQSVLVNVTRHQLKNAPQYSRAEHVDRQWELEYYKHLLQPGYWLTGDEARAIKEAQSFLRDETDRHEASVERRSRPR